jgi:hypothetical protein
LRSYYPGSAARILPQIQIRARHPRFFRISTLQAGWSSSRLVRTNAQEMVTKGGASSSASALLELPDLLCCRTRLPGARLTQSRKASTIAPSLNGKMAKVVNDSGEGFSILDIISNRRLKLALSSFRTSRVFLLTSAKSSKICRELKVSP